MTPSDKNPGKDTRQSHVYVIRIDFDDGTARHPVVISQGARDWELDLQEAADYFTNLHRGKGIVSIDYARNIFDAGVNDVENILEWKEFKARRRL